MPEPVGVFVSHSHADEAFTQRLVADLRAAGADVWVAETEIAYDDFIEKINDGLTGRQWFVLVMTPDALSSRWVRAEVNAAINLVQQGIMQGIIPVEAQECDIRTIPPLLARYHRYNATGDYANALAGLLRALGLPSLADRRTPPPQPITLPSAEGPQVSEAAPLLEVTPVIASAPPTPPPQPIIPLQSSPSSPSDMPASSEAPPVTAVSDITTLAESEPSSPLPLPPQAPDSLSSPTPRTTDAKPSTTKSPASARPALSALMRPLIAVILIVVVLGGALLAIKGILNPSSPPTHSNQTSQSISGSWSVIISGFTGGDLTEDWILQQNGDHITGTWSNSRGGQGTFAGGTIAGDTVSLDTSMFDLNQQGQIAGVAIQFNGTLSDQNHMTGSWNEPDTGRTGTFVASKNT